MTRVHNRHRSCLCSSPVLYASPVDNRHQPLYCLCVKQVGETVRVLTSPGRVTTRYTRTAACSISAYVQIGSCVLVTSVDDDRAIYSSLPLQNENGGGRGSRTYCCYLWLGHFLFSLRDNARHYGTGHFMACVVHDGTCIHRHCCPNLTPAPATAQSGNQCRRATA